MRRFFRPAGAGKALKRRAARLPDPGEIVGLGSVAKHVIYPHIFENADREVGGVLVGRAPSDGGSPMITGAIPAISADERRATLTFTQDAWAHVHHTLDTSFPPDEQIVGWYHSHPGFGIFLSGHDLFIHKNFFGAPSQIAVVVDPIARTEGAFAWREEELVCLYEQPTPAGWQASSELLDSVHEPHGDGGPPLRRVRAADVGTRYESRDRLLAIAGIATAAVILALALVFALGGSGSSSNSQSIHGPASVPRPGRGHTRSKPATGRVHVGKQNSSPARPPTTTPAVVPLPPATETPRYLPKETEPAKADGERESASPTTSTSAGSAGGGTLAAEPQTGGAGG